MSSAQHVYEVRPRKDKRGFDLISDALPFGRLWYGEPDEIVNAVGYAKFFSRLHHAAFSKKTGSTPGASRALQNIWRFRRSPCRLLRLPKRIGLKSYLWLAGKILLIIVNNLLDFAWHVAPRKETETRPFRMPALLGLLLCATGLLAIPGKAFAQVFPRGVFSLSNTDRIANDTVLNNPDVTGISIRHGWASLEPAEGVFDWTFLDSEVARAAAAGKQVMLRIGTQASKPNWVTTAIRNAGGTFFTFDDNGVRTTIPVFWDPTFLAKKTAMITALGEHFTNNPTVTIVVASFANCSSEDWCVPHTPPEIARWLALGYTSEKMLDTGRTIIDATMAAFPNQYVTLAVGSNGEGHRIDLDPTEDYVARNAVLNARASWPGRLFVQKNTLKTCIPAPPGTDTIYEMIWDFQPLVGWQMLFPCVNDPAYRVNCGVPIDPALALRESVDAGVSYGAKFIEIYQTDVINLPTVITYAQDALLGP